MKGDLWKEFLKDLEQALNWNKGIPQKVSKNKWRDNLYII
jgi:hypothetical protein